MALGPELLALFANDDSLADDLLPPAARSATRSGDCRSGALPAMHMSRVADINNISDSAFAGAIIAALYLAEFVPGGI